MKVRRDFVTNSSSSSFVINKKHLDQEQIEAIHRHSEIGEELGIDYSEEAWFIEENRYYIGGYTYMDNFSMEEFLEKIDVNAKDIEWSDMYPFKLPNDYKNWRDLL